MKKVILSTLLALALAFSANAQSTFGINLDAFLPAGELRKDSPELWGGGFNLEVAAQLKNSPIHVGGMIGLQRYGSEVRDGWHGSFLGDARVRRNNDIFNTLGLVRLKPETRAPIQPYIDMYAGFSYIFTTAHFRDHALGEEWDRDLDFDDFSFNYGFGGGVEFFLNDYLSLDVHVRSLKGSRTRYLTPRSVTYNPDIEGYDMEIKESRFDSLNFGVGIKVLLSEL